MSLDTKLPGSHQEVRAAGDWLDQLAAGLDTSADVVVAARTQGTYAWVGETADAYYDLSGAVVKATDEIRERAKDAATITHAYANQLQWRQEDMAAHCRDAAEAGLSVHGTIIEQPATPTPVADLPAGASREEGHAWLEAMDDYDRQVARVEAWNEAVEKVTATAVRLDTWVTDNLVDAQERALLPSLVGALLGTARAPDTYVGIGENVFAARAGKLELAAESAATALARRRSGNPAVRAGRVAPSKTGMENASKPGTRAGNLLDDAAVASRWARFLKWGGPIIAGGIGVYEISQGESPSKVVLQFGAGIATGVAVGALVAAGVIAGPAIVIGAGAALLGGAVAWGVGKAYESWVPQDVREKIDEGIKDTWDAATGGVSDAWNAVFG